MEKVISGNSFSRAGQEKSFHFHHVMEIIHFRESHFLAKIIFITVMEMTFCQQNSFSSSKWKWKLIYETHFHHRNDFSANGNGNSMAGTHFHSKKVIPIGPKLIFMQPELIFITEMEMTFAGETHFHFHDGNEFLVQN